jgi:hypothetical protein
MNLLKAKRTHLKEENRKYGPTLVPIPPSQWPVLLRTAERPPIYIWRSREFLVQFFAEPNCAGRLSINRTEINSDGGWKDGITWNELQELKKQAGFADCWAIEFFPPEDDVVNVANIRHVWLLDKLLPFGWHN